MALTSPGVQVTVIDESFYTPAEAGTTAMLVVATAQDKINAAGTATAVGTTLANVGQVYRITSQRELLDTFGVPFFEKTVTNTPIHGSERNEYGLLAAYSLLGVTNSVFVTRAAVNLDELEPATTEPGAEPTDGKWWLNTTASAYGIQTWNGSTAAGVGQRFSAATPAVLTDEDTAKVSGNAPRASFGSIGDYAMVIETGTVLKEFAKLYYKSAGNGDEIFPISGTTVDAGEWVLVGSNKWIASHPTVIAGTAVTGATLNAGDTFFINGTLVTVPGSATVAGLAGAINSASVEGVTARAISGTLYLYSDGTASASEDSTLNGAIAIVAGAGTVLTQIGLTAGVYYPPSVFQGPHTQVPAFKTADTYPRPTGSVWIKTTEPNQGARWRVSRWSSALQTWEPFDAPIYRNTHQAIYYLDRSGGGVNIPTGSILVQFNASEDDKEVENGAVVSGGSAQFRLWRRAASGETVARSKVIDDQFTVGSNSFTIKEMLRGELSLSAAVSVSFVAAGDSDDAFLFAAAVNAAGLVHVEARVTDNNEIELVHKTGGDIRITDGTATPIVDVFTALNVVSGIGTANFYALPSEADDDYLVSNWRPLIVDDFAAAGSEPLNEAQDGQLWYNPSFGEVDMMVHNGNTWVGYRNEFPSTDVNGPIVSASEPTTQSDGTSALVDNDLWISTADLENFPIIYRRKFTGTTEEGWYLVDKADQTTEEGVLFSDARWRDESGNSSTPEGAGTPGTIASLLTSNFLDFDAPDPDLYPKGMLLYNLRRSGGNVKIYRNSYVNTAGDNARFDATNSPLGNGWASGQSMANYATDRWTTYSANNEDGSGSFGRKAQRKVVVAAMKSVLDTNEQARDTERRNFNLLACPGYPETLSNLINLNIDRGYTSFVIGDTPLRLPSNATALLNYGTNAALVTDNGDDGIVSFDEYSAVYYPNGFTTDLGGSNAVVPASHMMLRTMTLSDQVSYPWFAPAGTRRGGITNATAVGYIDSLSGEFQTVALNEGQRDTLYDLKINPIPFFVGVGLVAYGQKTRARNASALDRINVARLVVYLRSQLNKLARPYVFEPNDKITRDEIKGAVESLLLELVGLRAIYDFAVVCDESNNTPSRVDRNELYVDIAIEPVKAVEFIYIPLRVQNTGEI